MDNETRHPLAERFERFAAECEKQASPFYARLSTLVAGDEDLLDVAAHASREPIPNVFLAAVHYLLLRGADHALRDYYSSLTDRPRDDDGLSSAFADFCAQSGDELSALVASRLVQTNEVNRAAILAPAFFAVDRAGGRQPMALVEIGSSAGLNLLWDRYRISYSDGTVLGDAASDVHVTCESRGAPLLLGERSPPTIVDRVGIDLNPIDLHDPDERVWLRALVWPDHRERAARLDAAIAVALQGLPTLVRGDALVALPPIMADVPRDRTVCVFHSSVRYQLTSDESARLESILADGSVDRPVWQVAAESETGLHVTGYRDGRKDDERLLAAFDTHGRWLRWEG